MPRPIGSFFMRPRGVAAGALIAALTSTAGAQTWGLAPTTTVDLPTSAVNTVTCDAQPARCCAETLACGPIIADEVMIENVLGWNNWWVSTAMCKPGVTGSCANIKSFGESVVRLRGLGSSSVLVRWDALARVKEQCRDAPGVYYANATASITAVIDLRIDGVEPGTPVIVFFRWKQESTNSFSPEGGAEDVPTTVTGGSLTVGGDVLFDGDFDRGVKGRSFSGDIFGSFGAVVGETVTIVTEVDLAATITGPGDAFPVPNWHGPPCWWERDWELTSWGGEIELSLGSAVPPPPGSYEGTPGEAEPQPVLLFSVDIGGDAELADPTPEGNEVFDPGDAYTWIGPPLPPGGMNGVIDDAAVFAMILGVADPTPAPGIPFLSEACLNTSPPAAAYFDLDDFDLADVALSSMIPIASPLSAPIPRFPSAMIHRLEHSVISFDDDGPEKFDVSFFAGFPYCSIPTGSTSGGAPPGGAATHGRTVMEDEVLQVSWTPLSTLPYLAGAIAPGLSEMTTHISLAPNPDPTDAFDDDVDGLDIIASGSGPTGAYLYLTSDHEATGVLAPVPPCPSFTCPPGPGGGWVYEYAPGGVPTPVILPSVHLGLPDTIDIRALEFVWLPSGPIGEESLAMIFSVAPNDPGTFTVDESGGLNPARLYYSFLTGSYADLVAIPFDDPVDAFSNYRRALLAEPIAPPPEDCPGDADGNNTVNFGDVTSVLANFGNNYTPGPPGTGPGDADHNGLVNFGDVTSVLANFGSDCS